MRKLLSFLLVFSLLACTPAWAEDAAQIDISAVSIPFLLDKTSLKTVSGKITGVSPLKSVTLEMYDIRQLKQVFTKTWSFGSEKKVFSFDAAKFKNEISPHIKAGEYTFTVTVSDRDGGKAARVFDSHVMGKFSAVRNMNSKCAFSSNVKKLSAFKSLWDNNVETYVDPGCNYTINIDLPEGRSAEYLCTQWNSAPTKLVLKQYDGKGTLISSLSHTNPKRMVALSFPIDENTRRISFTCSSPKSRLGELYVLEKGKVSSSALIFEPMPEKVDLMVFSAHQDDELLFLGGTIPYYAAQGKTVCVVYMARCSSARIIEALNGLNWCGIKYHPILLNHKDKLCSSLKAAKSLWGGADALYKEVTELIRRYKPEVVVTQDINGEYGHYQHQLTSLAVRTAVERAANSKYYPESSKKYGVWDTKKLYIHLYDKNTLDMKAYSRPLAAFNGLTATEVSKLAYSKHYSQWKGFNYDLNSKRYKNTRFGLFRTAVGPDKLKNDLFENIN
ncbi:MAG: PIG-L family deacetylase [Clostridiales bacterium]|nr:PIG-L family deacetylase [Clostridiales bacterium]